MFQVMKLLTETGYRHLGGDLGRVSALVQGSTKVVWAGDGATLLGFGSSITDGGAVGLVSHLAVRRDQRRRGLGRAIVERLIAGNPGVSFLVHASGDVSAFCARVGFTRASSVSCYVRKG